MRMRKGTTEPAPPLACVCATASLLPALSASLAGGPVPAGVGCQNCRPAPQQRSTVQSRGSMSACCRPSRISWMRCNTCTSDVCVAAARGGQQARQGRLRLVHQQRKPAASTTGQAVPLRHATCNLAARPLQQRAPWHCSRCAASSAGSRCAPWAAGPAARCRARAGGPPAKLSGLPGCFLQMPCP